MLVGLVGVTAVAAGAQFLPVLSVREGGQRFIFSSRADGYIAYLTLLNERDGGINGVPLVWEECETVYDVPRGVECYERLKAKGSTGAAVFQPTGTPIANALTERATQDQIPLLAVGLGRSDAAQVQWGLEHLTLTAAALKALGAEGLFPPLTLSCRDHEGGGSVKFQQWDGKQWTVLTDWIAPDQALVRPLVEASAARYAQEKGLTPRNCP
jgi:hypothetical protein